MSDFIIGETVSHPDGRKVKIIGKDFWIDGISCVCWYWQEIFPDGSLSLNIEHGYDWEH